MTTTSADRWIALKRIAFIVALIVGVASSFTPSPAGAQGHERDPAYAEFYGALDPHGEWIEHPRYGLTWAPFANQDQEWRPYSRGQWVFTEEHGWLWDSEEPFGWVVFHYGRWILDPYHRWMWVPGTEWGPAWVAWREGDEAVGWMPLPPEAEFDGNGQVTFDELDSPRYAPMWIFVAPALMTMPAVYRHFYPSARGSMFFGRTRFATHYEARDRRVYNRGIDRRFIESRAQRPVPMLQVRPLSGPRDAAPPRGPDGGDRRMVGIYRPQIARPGGARGSGEPGRRPDFSGRPDFPGRAPNAPPLPPQSTRVPPPPMPNAMPSSPQARQQPAPSVFEPRPDRPMGGWQRPDRGMPPPQSTGRPQMPNAAPPPAARPPMPEPRQHVRPPALRPQVQVPPPPAPLRAQAPHPQPQGQPPQQRQQRPPEKRPPQPNAPQPPPR